MSDLDDQTPPVSEEIHLPGPSLLPLMVALGVTATVIGTTLGLWLIAVGVIVFLTSSVIWIRSTRRDIEELPEDHHH